MKCNAMLFNLEQFKSKSDPTKTNNVLTFVDIDTGESFKTFVDADIALQYQKMLPCAITLSLSLNEYKGKTSMQARILGLVPVKKV